MIRSMKSKTLSNKSLSVYIRCKVGLVKEQIKIKYDKLMNVSCLAKIR